MYIYVRQKIYKFGEIDLVVLEIQTAEFGNFTVSLNNTLVCSMSSFVFMAADTLLCVLKHTFVLHVFFYFLGH